MRLSQDVTPHDHAFGSPSRAEVVLVEYADFECPYSKRAHAALKDLTSWYGNLVAIVFRHFPQSTIHPNARLAAEAAEAANSQGLFWEMHDYLFRNQQLLDRQHLLRYAKQLGLNLSKFTSELNTRRHRGRIEEDVRAGTASGVHSTPAFFLHQRRLQHSDTDDLIETVQCELNAKVGPRLVPVHGTA
jgi:protein-disulfide isomerase